MPPEGTEQQPARNASPVDAGGSASVRVGAVVLAWAWPGLGHIVLGHRRRGGLIMLGVLFLFFAGLLIGGLDVVDRRRDRLWFYAQSLCGPLAFAADFANQRLLDRIPDNWRENPDWQQRYRDGDAEVARQLRATSLGRVNEIGTLYIALAGLMNLVVILDAMHLQPAARRDRREADR